MLPSQLGEVRIGGRYGRANRADGRGAGTGAPVSAVSRHTRHRFHLVLLVVLRVWGRNLGFRARAPGGRRGTVPSWAPLGGGAFGGEWPLCFGGGPTGRAAPAHGPVFFGNKLAGRPAPATEDIA